MAMNTDDFLLSITSDNVEMAKGISYNPDGTYNVRKSKTLKELMVTFQQWWELVLSVKRTTDNAEDTRIYLTAEGVRGSINIRSAFDKYGHTTVNGMECPVCNGKFKYLRVGGYCSTECALKSVANKAVYFLLKPNDRYKQFDLTLDRLISVLDQTTLVLNALMGIPDIIIEMALLPQDYKDYVQKKINIAFCYLLECLLILMIKFNELLKSLLRPIKLGWISKVILTVFPVIEAIIKAMELAQKAFDAVYSKLITLLQSLKVTGVCINAEGIAWTLTPRSFISPLPVTSPDAGKLFVNLPGGLGLQSILATKPLMPSSMENMNFDKIDTFILKMFPPLTPLDYYLEPQLFDVRYLFSDQSPIVEQIKLQLGDMMLFGFDYLPAYKNMFPVKKYKNFMGTGKDITLPNIAYVWFLLGLLDGWAPHSKALVGSLIYPMI